jgi:hypothetical protein
VIVLLIATMYEYIADLKKQTDSGKRENMKKI